jgi:hypothetical protein
VTVAKRAALVVALFVLGAALGCVKRDTAVETQPVTNSLAAYWTCAVSFTSDGRGEDANEAFTFVPWFEGRVREKGVFEPLGRDEGAESEVTLRVDASQVNAERVSVRVLVVDTKTKESLGTLEAVGFVNEVADAGDSSEPRRLVALRIAADQILDLLKEKRRISKSRPKRPLPPATPPLPDGPPALGSATCSTQCHPPATSSSNHDEQYRVAAGMNATMKELRNCLDRIGGQLVEPAVLLRFSPDGSLRHMRVDVGGYENMECIQTIRSRPPRSVFTTRASLLRCEYHCTVS